MKRFCSDWVLKAAHPPGTGKPEQHRIFDNTLGNTQKLKMYTYTQANGYSVSILVKRPRYRRVIAQLVAIRGGGVISRTPRGPKRAPPPQWIWSLRYSLFPSFQAARRRHLVPSRPGEWGSGLLTKVIAPQRDPRLQLQLIQSSSGSLPQAPSCPPPPWQRRLSHELINVKIIGLGSLASGFHI